MLLYILSIIIILLLVIIILYIWHQQNYWSSLCIPCDKPHWIYGNLKDVTRTISFVDVFEQYYQRYRGQGPFVGFYFFFKPSAFVLEPALIKNILIKDFQKFPDRGFFVNETDDPLSTHLFNLEGEKWKNLRQKLTPTFTTGKMKCMFATVAQVADAFVHVIDNEIELSSSKSSIMQIHDLCARFTTDVIGSCAFGIDCNSLKDSSAPFRIMGNKALRAQRNGTLGVAFRFCWPKLARRLHMKDTTDDVEEFFLRLVKETIEYREKHHVKRNDFMDILLELRDNRAVQIDDGENTLNLTFEIMAAQAFVFLIAGYETSSTTISFALYELAQNLDIQDKVRNEIKRVLDKYNEDFSYECLKEMSYLEQIINETLRLYTIVPCLNRMCLEDYPVPGHPNYIIKKGMPVVIPIAAIHRDEKYYPNPNIFNPDNFSAEKIAERDSILFLPFGDGPRNCIGLRFGKMQTSIALVFLLRHFRFNVCTDTKIPMIYDKTSFLVSPENGIHLRVEKI